MQTANFESSFIGKRLLWIDDRVDIHRPLITRMEEYGIHVAMSCSVDEGLAELKDSRFDQIFLDAMIGHESVLPDIPRILDAAEGAQLSVCSGFMYRDYLQKQRDEAAATAGVIINTIEKEVLPEVEEPESVEEFLGALFHDVPVRAETAAAVAEATSLSMPYAEYVRLSLEDKMTWLDEVEPLVRDVCERHFEEGYAYILFCGSAEEPVLACASMADVPSEEDVIALARKRGFAPFGVHNLGTVDDVPGLCCERSGLAAYPTLIISAVEGERAEVHYDNGTSHSLMSYEWYGEKGWIPYARAPDLLRVGEMRLKGVRYTLENCEFIDAMGQSLRTDFRAYYIMQWENCRLSVACGPACQNAWRHGVGPQVMCQYRTGLLGRSLQREELKVDFVMEREGGRVRFVL